MVRTAGNKRVAYIENSDSVLFLLICERFESNALH